MTPGMAVLILIGSMLVALATGLPVAFAIGGVGTVLIYFLWGVNGLHMVYLSAWASMSNLILIAIPLFILLGFVLQKSGLAEALYHSIHSWMGGLNGGLAIATIGVCTFIAAMVGTLGAGIVTAGVLALPEIRRHGYEKRLTYGTIMAGGGLGMLIPPSVSMLLYAGVTQMSVGKIFAGGIFPGLILSGLYMLYIGIRCRLNPSMGPALPKEERVNLRRKIIGLKDSFLAVVLIFGVLGSIFMGVATPTEAAAVGAFGSIVIAAIYGRLNWTVMKEALFGTAKLYGMVMFIIIGAGCFGRLFVAMGAEQVIEGMATAFTGNPWFIIIAMQFSLILLGMFLDDWVVILLVAPIYAPIVIALGFDPLWFAILFMVNMQIALLTPPYGFALYYMRTLVPEEPYESIARSILPFFGLQVIGLVIVMIAPPLATWLPNVLIK